MLACLAVCFNLPLLSTLSVCISLLFWIHNGCPFFYHWNYPEIHCDYFGWSYPIWLILWFFIILSFLLGYASVLTPSKACFRASNSVKFKIFIVELLQSAPSENCVLNQPRNYENSWPIKCSASSHEGHMNLSQHSVQKYVPSPQNYVQTNWPSVVPILF